jgi:hypothetical protein
MNNDLDRPGDLQVENRTQGPDACHFGCADAERERAKRAVGRRVAVGSDYDFTGSDVAVLGQDLMADAPFVAADVVKPRNSVASYELADGLLVCGRLGAFSRNAVVEDNGNAGGIPDPGRRRRASKDLVKLVDHKRGVLVRHGQVHGRLDHVAGPHRGKPGSLRQYLLRNRHSHTLVPLDRGAYAASTA